MAATKKIAAKAVIVTKSIKEIQPSFSLKIAIIKITSSPNSKSCKIKSPC